MENIHDVWVALKDYWYKIDLKKWSQEVGGSSAEAVLAAAYFGIAFAVGLIFRKHLKFLFWSLIGAALVIKVLEYNTIIQIDWVMMKNVTGVTSVADLNGIINIWFDWVKHNVFLFVAATVGFLIGCKLA